MYLSRLVWYWVSNAYFPVDTDLKPRQAETYRSHFMQQLLERHRRDCDAPTGGTEHKPILYPSRFQCTMSSSAARRSMLALTSDTTTSPLTSKPHAKNFDLLQIHVASAFTWLRARWLGMVLTRLNSWSLPWNGTHVSYVLNHMKTHSPKPGVCPHEHVRGRKSSGKHLSHTPRSGVKTGSGATDGSALGCLSRVLRWQGADTREKVMQSREWHQVCGNFI